MSLRNFLFTLVIVYMCLTVAQGKNDTSTSTPIADNSSNPIKKVETKLSPTKNYYLTTFNQHVFQHVSRNSSILCENLPAYMYECGYNYTCVYGQTIQTECVVPQFINCSGKRVVIKKHVCAYCYQLHPSNYTCTAAINCKVYAKYLAECTTLDRVHCLGNRVFSRYRFCDYSTGVRRDYALVISVLFGGFGFDRVYLGSWQEGFGKLFSFGGLGVWTLIDIILIWIGYLKPIDGTLFS